jgi:hypothetical protein
MLRLVFRPKSNLFWRGMWQYDPYHNSIVTGGNGGTKPTRLAFTIFYNQGTQRYDLEQTLRPDEQMWIDVGKLIRERVPDKNGKTLPADLTSGSYEFRDLTNIGVGTLFEGKVIYDKTYGHVAYGCGTCCGWYQPKFFYNPLLVPVGSTAGNGVTALDQCTGKYDDVSGAFYGNWSSANTGIVTVNYYGTHSAVSPGSTTSSTSGWLTHYGHWLCPDWQPTPSGGATVQKPTYFLSNVAVQTAMPPACTQAGYSGYFIDISYWVADQNGNSIQKSGMAPGENLGDGKWNDAYATPPTTKNDGSFHDTPVGTCYGGHPGHYCQAGPSQSFRITNNGVVFPIMTNTTGRDCTDGIQLVIQGNPTGLNTTYTFGNTQ